MNRDYIAIGHWCIDAHNVTAPEIPEKVAQLRLAAITAHIGKSSIIGIAKELSEGLDSLSADRRGSAQNFLVSKHGFGFDYFMQQGQLKLARIIARGKVRNENEHRMIIDALSDTTIDSSLSAQLEKLLAAHESKSSAA